MRVVGNEDRFGTILGKKIRQVYNCLLTVVDLVSRYSYSHY